MKTNKVQTPIHEEQEQVSENTFSTVELTDAELLQVSGGTGFWDELGSFGLDEVKKYFLNGNTTTGTNSTGTKSTGTTTGIGSTGTNHTGTTTGTKSTGTTTAGKSSSSDPYGIGNGSDPISGTSTTIDPSLTPTNTLGIDTKSYDVTGSPIDTTSTNFSPFVLLGS